MLVGAAGELIEIKRAIKTASPALKLSITERA
jgi:hypothetical protein